MAATAGVGPSRYTVAEGESLRSIARTMLGDERMWYLIADANGLSGSELVKGQSLVIPSAPLHANAVDTFKPYDPSQITGDLRPALPVPGDMGGCGAVGQIVLVIVAVVVTIYMAGAASQFLLGAAGTGSASTFGAGLTALSGGYGAGGIAASVIGGAAGSIASQSVGLAIGATDRFSWSQVGLSALGAGITAGVGTAVTDTALSAASNTPKWLSAAGRSAIAAAATQGVAVAVGGQERFSWRSVAASAVSAGVGQGLNVAMGYNPTNGFDFGKSLVSGLASSAVGQAVRGGKVNAVTLATDAFGNALGDSLAAANSSASTQGVGPWSDVDYRNSQDIESDNAALQRQSQPYYDQVVGAFGQLSGTAYRGVQLAAGPGYSGMGMTGTDRDQNIARMRDLADSSGVSGRVLNADGEANGPIDMAPTRANAMRLGLMGPYGQTDGAWSSPVAQSNVVGVPLPPVDASQPPLGAMPYAEQMRNLGQFIANGTVGAAEIVGGGLYNYGVGLADGVASVLYLLDSVDAAVAVQEGLKDRFGYELRSSGAQAIGQAMQPVGQWVQGNIMLPTRAYSERLIGDSATTLLGGVAQAGFEIAGVVSGGRAVASALDNSVLVWSAAEVGNVGNATLADTGQLIGFCTARELGKVCPVPEGSPYRAAQHLRSLSP